VALIEIVREVRISAEESWNRLTDWEKHGRVVPLTTVTRTGSGFVARTGVGPIAFDDPMEIVEWREPSFCRLEKRGRVVVGSAEIGVQSLGSGSRVTWRENVHVRGVPRALDRLERRVATAVFGRVIDRLLAGP
jgi:hypothetical protein